MSILVFCETMRRILLAEDEKFIQELYQKVLEDAGFCVDTADDGEAALQKASEQSYDLVLLDIIMPKKDGLSVLKELRIAEEKAPRRKIVMLTVLTADECLNTAMSAGADDYLDKTNLTPGQVVERVKALLASG